MEYELLPGVKSEPVFSSKEEYEKELAIFQENVKKELESTFVNFWRLHKE